MSEQHDLACYYCGMPALTIDHTIPKIILKSLAGQRKVLEELIGERKLTVSSCRECNSLLSSSYQKTLIERKSYLKFKLTYKYQKLLDMPKWTKEEIKELGPDLKQDIINTMKQKKLIQKRLKW